MKNIFTENDTEIVHLLKQLKQLFTRNCFINLWVKGWISVIKKLVKLQ